MGLQSVAIHQSVERVVSSPTDEQPAGQSRSITPAIAWPKPMHMHATP
jgi:hypothetical protein